MAMREKDQADFDLETFVDLFDTAISSDNPTVQRALKNLILVSSIVNAQENAEGLRKGPLRRVIEDIQVLNKRISNLEGAGAYRSTYVTTTSPGTIPPGTIVSGTSTIAARASTNQTKSYVDGHGDVFDVKVGSLLDKLEIK